MAKTLLAASRDFTEPDQIKPVARSVDVCLQHHAGHLGQERGAGMLAPTPGPGSSPARRDGSQEVAPFPLAALEKFATRG